MFRISSLPGSAGCGDPMQPMSTFEPTYPCEVHDITAGLDRWCVWRAEDAERYTQCAEPHHMLGVIVFDDLLINGWRRVTSPLNEINSRLKLLGRLREQTPNTQERLSIEAEIDRLTEERDRLGQSRLTAPD